MELLPEVEWRRSGKSAEKQWVVMNPVRAPHPKPPPHHRCTYPRPRPQTPCLWRCGRKRFLKSRAQTYRLRASSRLDESSRLVFVIFSYGCFPKLEGDLTPALFAKRASTSVRRLGEVQRFHAVEDIAQVFRNLRRGHAAHGAVTLSAPRSGRSSGPLASCSSPRGTPCASHLLSLLRLSNAPMQTSIHRPLS